MYVYSEIIWTSSLYPFYRLVRGKAVLDLKNRAQYKTNSTYIFEGEIVDADALGNIVYGYIGEYLGIPRWVLLSGGGFDQTVTGTASEEFYEYNFDDPKG